MREIHTLVAVDLSVLKTANAQATRFATISVVSILARLLAVLTLNVRSAITLPSVSVREDLPEIHSSPVFRHPALTSSVAREVISVTLHLAVPTPGVAWRTAGQFALAWMDGWATQFRDVDESANPTLNVTLTEPAPTSGAWILADLAERTPTATSETIAQFALARPTSWVIHSRDASPSARSTRIAAATKLASI